MEATILGIAAKIGTPLALAGLLVGVLYLLYRTLLRGRLLSTVGPGHSFRIINRILNFVFVLSLVAIVLGVASYLATALIKPPRYTSALEVTDIAVIPRPSFPVLDLKFRNLGRDVAYIKKVAIEIVEKKIEEETNRFFAGPSTWQYNVLLNPRSDQRQYEISTSQIVPSNGTDRFSVVVGQQSGYGDIRYTDYRLRVRVFYNANEVSETKDVTMRIHSPPHFLSPEKVIGSTIEDRLAALDSLDPLTVSEISTVVGAIGNQDAVPKLLSIFKKDPNLYITFYEGELLPKPFHRQRGIPPNRALTKMYASAFWALKQITGDYHEGILAEMSPKWRSVGEEAMKAVKGG